MLKYVKKFVYMGWGDIFDILKFHKKYFFVITMLLADLIIITT